MEFETWWKEQGQFHRAGGGEYEKTFAWGAWNAALTEAATACDVLAKSYDNEHNRSLGTAEDMASIAEDCAEEIRSKRVNA